MPENRQLPMPADYSGVLRVHSVFPTIQGEGPFCGERALFFRLHGCNLRCPGCDTDYTTSDLGVTPAWFVKQAEAHDWPRGALIVITGGEPFRQDVVPAIAHLLDAGYRVQIETNGVLAPPGLHLLDDSAAFTIVCSPKTSSIAPAILERAAAFKYVLRADQVDPCDGLPLRALQHKAAPRVARPRPGTPVYVQPMDEADSAANALNLDAAIRSTMQHGHKLQIQVHKIINME